MEPYRSDDKLIDQFLTGQKDDSEKAFETLVKRYGPMVLGVCRAVLRRDQDAEDAFQATFLALARKAGTIRNRLMLGAWLHAVAYRNASRARGGLARSRSRMRIYEVEERRAGPVNAASREELRTLVREEVDSLPAETRSLVLQSYMEGKSNEQVARLLQCPVGTVKGRLSRARNALRARLGRRGLNSDDVRYGWG
jgi:RNA polymerase sigma-70 factor (ECF subfamily)